MKFFNKKAFTITELIASIIIISIMFISIIMFLSGSTNVMIGSNREVKNSSSIFEVKMFLDKINSENYTDFKIRRPTNAYPFILFTDNLSNKWVLFWVVDKKAKSLKKYKTFWENYVWYRYISKADLQSILNNQDKAYDIKFFKDSIIDFWVIKDFELTSYKERDVLKSILELDFNVLNNNIKWVDWASFSDMDIWEKQIYKYNLVF